LLLVFHLWEYSRARAFHNTLTVMYRTFYPDFWRHSSA
jgi:hypothetical protein